MGAELNSEELMHLALYATNHEKPQEAIGYLKQILKVEPTNGKALYLLGALHAEIGMHDDAIREIRAALENDSTLPPTAVFQLGLLHLTKGEVPEAEEAWAPLAKLNEADPLNLFKAGMLHLVRDEYAECIQKLHEGIHKNDQYEDLNADMRRVVQDAEAAMADSSKELIEQPSATGGESPKSRLMIYEQDID